MQSLKVFPSMHAAAPSTIAGKNEELDELVSICFDKFFMQIWHGQFILLLNIFMWYSRVSPSNQLRPQGLCPFANLLSSSAPFAMRITREV